MMNRISLSSFAFLIILISLRIELCYGLDFVTGVATAVVGVILSFVFASIFAIDVSFAVNFSLSA